MTLGGMNAESSAKGLLVNIHSSDEAKFMRHRNDSAGGGRRVGSTAID